MSQDRSPHAVALRLKIRDCVDRIRKQQQNSVERRYRKKLVFPRVEPEANVPDDTTTLYTFEKRWILDTAPIDVEVQWSPSSRVLYMACAEVTVALGNFENLAQARGWIARHTQARDREFQNLLGQSAMRSMCESLVETRKSGIGRFLSRDS